MDKYVVARMGINLCPDCTRKYGPTLTNSRHNYVMDKNMKGWKLGVCDGCAAGNDSNPIGLCPHYAAENFENDRIKHSSSGPF